MSDKRRDTIHISYNDKDYYEQMSELVDEWDKQNKVRSKEVCKLILAMNNINNSITLNKIINIYTMIENILLPFFENKKDPKYKQVTEAIFSEVISINGDKFSTFFSDPFSKIQELMEKSPNEKIQYINQSETSQQEIEIISKEKNVNIVIENNDISKLKEKTLADNSSNEANKNIQNNTNKDINKDVELSENSFN